MSELTRIIAIDNISRNQIIYINANEHTNFMGENGAGKTTTLRASLLFYGSRPGDIAKAKGDTFEGFAAFYFPKPTSYLVYEYKRAGELLCVVCSANNGQVQYQFMNTGFDEALFIHDKDNVKMISPTNQLRLNIEHKGFELSRKVGPDVYAEIIQSNMPYRKKTGASSVIRELRPRYSLPTKGGSIQNINRVLANIFSSKASIAHIQSALTDILIQDSLIPAKTLKLDEQSNSINEWFTSREAWLSLEDRRENITQLVSSVTKHHAIEEQLSFLLFRCLQLKSLHTDRLEALEEQTVIATNGEKEARKKHSELVQENHSKRLEFETSIQTVNAAINELVNIKQGFETGSEEHLPIIELKNLHAKLSTLQYQEETAQRTFNEINSGVSNITAFYDAKFAEIDNVRASLTSVNQTQITESQTQKFNEINGLTEQYKLKAKSINSLFESKRSKIEKNIQTLENTSGKLEAQLQDKSFNELFSKSIKALEEEVKTANRYLTEATEENQKITTELSRLNTERGKVSDKNIDLKLQRQKLIDTQGRIREQLESGTLFDFLHENAPDFQTTIGKVINPDLLTMKGLNPTFQTQTNSIYGLTLNLDGIDSPKLLHKSELHEKIIELDELISNFDTQISAIESELGKYNEQIRKKGGDLSRSKIECSEAVSYAKEQQEELEAEKTQATVEVTTRHVTIKEKLKQTTLDIVALKNTSKTLSETRDEDLKQCAKDEENAKEALEQAHKRNVESYNLTLTKALAEQDQNANTLSEQKNTDIEKKGLSPERLQQAQLTLTNAIENVRRAMRAGERVTRYDSFLTTQWIKHQPLVIDKQEKSDKLAAFINSSEEAEQALQQGANDLLKTIEDNNNNALDIANAMRVITELIDDLLQTGIEATQNNESVYASMDAYQCKVKFTKLKADHETNKISGSSQFNILDKTFCKTTGTPTRKFYEKMRNELLKRYQSQDLWWASSPVLAEYIENEHVSQSDLLRSNYILVAKKIADFSELISTTHSSLNSLGKKLTGTTSNVVSRFEAIDKIQIRVSSKLKNLSYFSALETFSKAHEHWTTHNSNQLPDDALIAKLTNLIDMIGNNKLHIDVDKSFLFEVELQDNGTVKRARTDDEIESLSSTGLSYLIIIAIYIGLVNLLRTDPTIRLLFCVDEIGKLSKLNTGKLISLFDEHNIGMYSALPDASPELLQHYPYAYNIIETGKHSRIYQLYGDESRITTESKILDIVNSNVQEA